MVPSLCKSGFVERSDNLLAFGLPGRGKTHLVCAIGHELIHHGHRVLFTPTYALVQRLLAAKRDLPVRLERELATLDKFDAVILDDIGYVQQNRDEMEVPFTFLAERYERRSVIITSNLVFSEWDRIFKDPMTTAAAIDRLVHHSLILEMTGTSIRVEQAHSERSPSDPEPTTTANTPNITSHDGWMKLTFSRRWSRPVDQPPARGGERRQVARSRSAWHRVELAHVVLLPDPLLHAPACGR